MFQLKTRFRLCELFGIPLYVDLTFAILMLMFLSSRSDFLMGIFAALTLAVSVVAHELGHALTARMYGYGTRDITVSLLGGCASLCGMPRKASQEFLTAAAGPAVSFLLGIAAIAGIAAVSVEGNAFELVWKILVSHVGYSHIQGHYLFVGAGGAILVCTDAAFRIIDMLLDVACMNLMLGVFNLLPGFPMDGGRIFRSFMRAFMGRAKATFVAMWVGRAFAILLALSGFHALFAGGSWGVVRLMIAWMIWQEGYREYLQTLMEPEWNDPHDWRAKVSPPPYGGDSEDVGVNRD